MSAANTAAAAATHVTSNAGSPESRLLASRVNCQGRGSPDQQARHGWIGRFHQDESCHLRRGRAEGDPESNFPGRDVPRRT